MLAISQIVKPLVLKATGAPTKVVVEVALYALADKLGITNEIALDLTGAFSTKEDKIKAVAKLLVLAVAAGLVSTVISNVLYDLVVDKVYKGDVWITGPFAL